MLQVLSAGRRLSSLVPLSGTLKGGPVALSSDVSVYQKRVVSSRMKAANTRRALPMPLTQRAQCVYQRLAVERGACELTGRWRGTFAKIYRQSCKVLQCILTGGLQSMWHYFVWERVTLHGPSGVAHHQGIAATPTRQHRHYRHHARSHARHLVETVQFTFRHSAMLAVDTRTFARTVAAQAWVPTCALTYPIYTHANMRSAAPPPPRDVGT